MAIATPGRVSEMSDLDSATAPTAPVANAATRSMSRGLTRDATCEFSAATTGIGVSSPITSAIRNDRARTGDDQQDAAQQVGPIGQRRGRARYRGSASSEGRRSSPR